VKVRVADRTNERVDMQARCFPGGIFDDKQSVRTRLPAYSEASTRVRCKQLASISCSRVSVPAGMRRIAGGRALRAYSLRRTLFRNQLRARVLHVVWAPL